MQLFKGINKKLLSVLFIVGILIIGGGAFGYFYYFQETPENIIKKMYLRLAEVKSLEYQGEAKGEITVADLLDGGNFMQVSQTVISKEMNLFLISFRGKADISDLDNPRKTVSFNIKSDALEALTQKESSLGVETRVIDQVRYLKFDNIVPEPGLLDLSFLNNQWIKIDAGAIKEQFGLDKLPLEADDLDGKELTFGQKEKLKQLILQAKVIKVTETLPSAKIDGIDTHHYRFIIDKDVLKKLAVDIIMVVQQEALTEKEVADFNAEFDKEWELVNPTSGEIWIGKKDFLPYKISLIAGSRQDKDSETVNNLTVDLLFKNYNKPVQINTPSPTKELLEIWAEFFNVLMSDAKLPEESRIELNTDIDEYGLGLSRELRVDTDGDGLSNVDEVEIYKTDPNNSDTDGDGFKDGEEVEKGYNPNGPGELFQ